MYPDQIKIVEIDSGKRKNCQIAISKTAKYTDIA